MWPALQIFQVEEAFESSLGADFILERESVSVHVLRSLQDPQWRRVLFCSALCSALCSLSYRKNFLM